MKITGTIIFQALLAAVIMVVLTTFLTSMGEESGFFNFLLRWVTLIQFVILFLTSLFFFYFRNKRINEQNNKM